MIDNQAPDDPYLRVVSRHPIASRAGVVVMVIGAVIALAMQIVAIHGHSLSGDGSYHLVAGHQALRYGRDTTNLEHPPLAKLVFALPTVFTDVPLAPPITVEEAVPTTALVYGIPGDHRSTVRGRYMALFVFVLPLIGACYALGAGSGGRTVGVLLALTLALSFSVIGNLTILQTDVAVTLAFVLTVLAAHRYLRRPSLSTAVMLGAAWGLGLSVKFSAVFLAPTVLFTLWLAHRQTQGPVRVPVRQLIRDGILAAVVAMGLLHLAYLVANLDYSSEVGRATITAYTNGQGTMAVDDLLASSEPWLLGLERIDPFLAQWLTGLLAVQAHNAIGVYPSYAFGEVSSAGHWWYHPAVLLLKIPLALLIAALVGLGVWWWRREPGQSKTPRHWSALTQLSVLTVLVYAAAAMTSNYNLGFRHLLPILPFLYLPVVRMVAASRVSAIALVLVLAVESLAMAPLWASQTNTWWLRAQNPTRFSLSHGNLDFGQNLVQLADVVRRRGLGDVGILDPRLRPQVVASYLDQAHLVYPGDSLPDGWYAVNAVVEQLLPAALREDVGYVYGLDALRAQAQRWKPLWQEITTGVDHGYVAGTFHLYRLSERGTRRPD